MIFAVALLTGCSANWNDPYPAAEHDRNIFFSAFTERPKHLDPVQSYSEDEIVFTGQIYEPPLQYHYLKRPYQVVSATAEAVPEPRYVDTAGHLLSHDADPAKIAYTDYVIRIKAGIRYQPHPAFAAPVASLDGIRTMADFPKSDSRELRAEDYVYEIKRLAHPRLHSPILGLMADYIDGLGGFAKQLSDYDKAHPSEWLDLRQFNFPGVQVIDSRSYRIRLKGKYPQFVYWLTMPFFAPIPWEVDRFYNRPGMEQRNLSLDWYPVGTGPYMLTENDPNRRMVLTRNPNFRGEPYPCEGESGDKDAGLLADCGKTMPFIDKAVFTREKEQIPYWNKFLQGYYDTSGIASDSFDQAVRVGSGGETSLTPEMQAQGIRLSTSVATSSMYMGFNWQDSLVGGGADPRHAERARKIRQAISIALDEEEFISIFANGRGISAQGPLPPGIFGYREGQGGVNPVVYRWQDGRPQRRNIEEAQRLLDEAGYPNGRDAKTGEPLIVNLDTTLNGVGAKSRVDWLQKQLAKINVQLVVRSTDYNRFQEKLLKGTAQLFYFGWNADYPDPENFLFLLYGPQGKLKHQGENAANYENPEYDRLFERMKTMDNGPERQAIIDRMVEIARRDAPWIWGFHPLDYTLAHQWLSNRKPIKVGHNTLKYQRIDAQLRDRLRHQWNRPHEFPLVFLGLLVIVLVLLSLKHIHQRDRAAPLS
ncbi:MAG TPA: ABC transporter substrate-binding protein [Rhodocyclaceae bacterium]|nr:ABC transporter substrate-binding protein [Rhodocyclaceae bacterium]